MADIRNKFDFSNRRVLITGGAGGIGKATVKAFLNLNATVLVLDQNEALLEELKNEFPQVQTVKTDIADWQGVEQVIKSLLPVHHLVNCAGILGAPTELLTIQEDDFDSIMNVNTKALIRISQLVGRGMVDQKLEGATIVNISSVISSVTLDNMFAYGVTKAAVDYVTKVTATELASFKIRVNGVRPGLVRTRLSENLPEEQKQAYQVAFNAQKYHRDFLDPEHVAQTIVYLSSPMSEMITGTNVTVDAGYTL